MSRAAILFLACTLVGCNSSSGSSNSNDAQFEVLKIEIDKLKTDNSSLRKEISDIRIEQIGIDLKRDQNYAAFDSRESAGYSRITSPVGILLVSLKQIDPYLDGYTITLEIGNPTTAMLHGVKGVIKWGPEFNPNEMTPLQEKKFELVNDFQSGAWTSIKLNIGPASSAQVRRIVFVPEFNQMSLRRPLAPS